MSKFRPLHIALGLVFVLLLGAGLWLQGRAPEVETAAVLSQPAGPGEEYCPCHGGPFVQPERNALPVRQNPQAALQYHRDIAPILERHCVSCHTPGGFAPFALEGYPDVASLAHAIGDAVKARRMPPSNANNSGTCQLFKDARWLSEAEISTVTGWVAEGFMEGTAREGGTSAAAPDPGAQLAPNLVLAPEEDFTPLPDKDKPDTFRCFPLRTGLSSKQYVSAFDIRPGNASIVHHVSLWAVDSVDGTQAMARAEAADPAPGFSCPENDIPDKRFIGGWLPGAQPIRWPEGMGIPLGKEQSLLLEVHYFGGGPEISDRTQVLLEMNKNPLADIEFLIFHASRYFPLVPGERRITARQAHSHPALQEGFQLLAIAPHMHTMGQSMRVEMQDAGKDTCLVDADRWNFRWQQAFFYKEPLRFSPSEHRRLSITCTFDTTGADDMVPYGMHTEDEMCQVLLAVTAP